MTVGQPGTTGAEAAIAIPVPELRHLVLAASVFIALLQAVGGAVGEGAALAGLLLAGLIGWKVDFRYMAALLILSFPAMGLAQSGGEFDASPLFQAVRHVSVAGVDLAAPLVAMLAAATRTLLEAARPRVTRLGWFERWPLLLFLLALVFAVLSGLYGRSLNLNRWSEGIRSVLAVGGFFWGFALARTAYFSAEHLERQAALVTMVGCALVAVGVLRGHFIFLLTGLAAALLPVFISRRRWIAAALAAWLCAYALGSTLTMAAIVLLSATAVILASIPLPQLRRLLVNAAVAFVVVGSVGAIWAVRTYGGSLAIELTAQAAEAEGLLGYAVFKLMGDRGPLWLAALQQIVSGPHLIAPTGRPLIPMLAGIAGPEWLSGPHNSILQVLRSIGLLGGPILLGLMAYFLFRALRSMIAPGSGVSRPLAAAFIGVVLAGVTTGDFPVQDVGFFLWTMGGIAVGSAIHPVVTSGPPSQATP